MASLRDHAVVLRTWEYSETSQTVALLAREHGAIRGLAKGARRPASKFGGGFEIVTLGELIATLKPGAELANIIEWDLQEVFRGPRRSLAAFHASLYIVDLVYHAVIDQDPHPALFDELVRALRDLSEPDRIWTVLARFQWSLLRETGYQPELDPALLTQAPPQLPDAGSAPATRRTILFSPSTGRFLSHQSTTTAGSETWTVRRETAIRLREIAQHAPDADLQPDPNDADASSERASRLLAMYLRHVLDRDLPTRRHLWPDARNRKRPEGTDHPQTEQNSNDP